MNLSEFKAWFEGFTESMDGAPGDKAWKRICDRVKSIKNDEPTTKHVFHDYYERPWRRWYDIVPYPSWSSSVQGLRSNLADGFDSRSAFARLGSAEALSVSHPTAKAGGF